MQIPASKSILNRLLIIQSLSPAGEFQIIGDSDCDDVRAMKAGLISLAKKETIDCHDAGTVLRFLALRASREQGEFCLTGSPRLFERPQEPLVDLLKQLGVEAKLESQKLRIQSNGWKKPAKKIQIDGSLSSQFASALLLSSWNLPFDVPFEIVGEKVSSSYFDLTKKIVERCRTKKIWEVEIDCSCAFAVAALGVVGEGAMIENFPRHSLQPDVIFPEILSAMGVKLSVIPLQNGIQNLKVEPIKNLKPVQIDCTDTPDLYPVLSVLTALADGKSVLRGAPHLIHKESNRVEKTAELLRKMKKRIPFVFDPAGDHRLVMAAAVAQRAGFPIQILHPEVVNKSFTSFFSF